MEEMPYEELIGWFEYFERRPVGWREDDRAFRMIQYTSFNGVKAKPYEIFHNLKQIYKPKKLNGLKESAFFQKLITATGGDKLEW
jgi:hypothetical protein